MRNGFSLVELSIVLVILGLLTGGILAGQSLIRAAELRSVTTEFQRYQAAVMTFRDKYFALPGDMTNATAFWDEMTNCNAASPSGTGTQTCNGNGNGKISPISNAHGRVTENFMFWRHLNNAGLLEGNYSGIQGAFNDNINSDNVPQSKANNAQWHIVGKYTDPSIAPAFFFDITYGALLALGKGTNHSQAPTHREASFSPEEAWNIDKKIDDGLPGTGMLMSYYFLFGASTDCHTSSSISDLTGKYNLIDNDTVCSLVFPDPF